MQHPHLEKSWQQLLDNYDTIRAFRQEQQAKPFEVKYRFNHSSFKTLLYKNLENYVNTVPSSKILEAIYEQEQINQATTLIQIVSPAGELRVSPGTELVLSRTPRPRVFSASPSSSTERKHSPIIKPGHTASASVPRRGVPASLVLPPSWLSPGAGDEGAPDSPPAKPSASAWRAAIDQAIAGPS
jgi:hypothetical protein